MLYDLDNAPATMLPSQYSKYASTYTSTTSCNIGARAISQPYFIHNSTRLTLLTQYGVKGLTVSDTSDLDLVDLLPGNFHGRSICMGYNLAAIIRRWPTILIVQYAWLEEDPYSATSTNTITKTETFSGDPNLLIDLTTGRVVIAGHSHGKHYVLEPSGSL